MARFLALLIFIVVLQVVGFLLGTSFPADAWYIALNKPFFNPPGQLFGIVWPILYLLIAIAGWRVFVASGEKPGWNYWVLQMLGNWMWTPIFFGLHEIFWALATLLITLVAAIGFVGVTWERDRFASLCFVPYVAWLGFATLLNFSIWLMN